MRIGFVTSNPNFWGAIEQEVNARGHDVVMYQQTNDHGENMRQLGRMQEIAERVFVDWAQSPLDVVLHLFDCPIFVRAHRIEMYNQGFQKALPWGKVHTLFFIAKHVAERFEAECLDAKPKNMHLLPHVGIDPDFWVPDATARRWEPPYRVAMAGSLVPKKRVYTTVQLVWDLGDNYHFEFHGEGGLPGYGNDEYGRNIMDLLNSLPGMRESGPEGRFWGQGKLGREDLRTRFQGAHFIVSASNEEGCHTAIAEAMACGCVPLVNAWRGASNMYPEEWVWRSPKEFYALVERWEAMPPEDKIVLSDAMRTWVAERYDSRKIASEMVDIICGPADAKTVGEWYGTNMLEHMIGQEGNNRQEWAVEAVRKWMPGTRYCDVGCGTGWIARQIAAQEGFTVAGIDVSEALVARAQEMCPRARWVAGDALQGLPAGEWDCISLFDVLEHIPLQHHETLIRRVAYQLATGGVCIAHFPTGGQSKQIVEETLFPRLLRQQFRQAGMEVVSYRYIAKDYMEIISRKGAQT